MTRARPYLIAEIGVNHNGDPKIAEKLIRSAASCGFDAVKFQYWIEDELLANEAPSAPYQGESDQREMLRSLWLDITALASLRVVARDVNIDFACTADGEQALVDVLTLEPDFLKVGSGDADNPWLLEAVAAVDLPTIISFGMTSEAEIRWIVGRLQAIHDLTVMHCVSAYPTPLAATNLGRITWLTREIDRPAGFSDHSLGSAAAIAALALGAQVIEKHITFDVGATGPDHAASLPISEAQRWTTELRDVNLSLEQVSGVPNVDEQSNRSVVRKALYASRDLSAGHRLQPADLVPRRPLLGGIAAHLRDEVVGRTIRDAVEKGHRLEWHELG